MREKVALAFLLLAFAFGLSQAGEEQWLHVRVTDGDEKVSVNLPLDLIESVLEHVDCDEFSGGAVHIEDQEFDKKLLSSIVDAAKKSKDGNFVVVESDDEQIRVRKQGQEIRVEVEEGDESVLVRIPLKVAEALMGGGEDELDLVAGLRELSKHGGSTLVTVEGDGEQVRVWVDSSMEGI